jgi:acetyl-CoA carboxylase carboxyl transferase subunit alpha
MATCTIVEASKQAVYIRSCKSSLCGDTFLELHGDRGFKDDKAMIGGLKNWWSIFMIVGQQKDITTKTIQKLLGWQTRRISKALRLMKMAEKFGIPVLTLIDTRCLSRAEAEERTR